MVHCGPPFNVSLVPRPLLERQHGLFSLEDLSLVAVLRTTSLKRVGAECLQKVEVLALFLLPVQFGCFLSERTQVLRPPGSEALPPHGDNSSPPLGCPTLPGSLAALLVQGQLKGLGKLVPGPFTYEP